MDQYSSKTPRRADVTVPGVAIVGTGFMGPAHLEALRRLGVKVVGALGSSPEKSRRFAERWGLGRAYENFAEIISDDRVNVVHITAPNRLHYEMAKAAIKAGKHVLCEKPLAMDSRQSFELIELIEQSGPAGPAAGVNYNIRFYPLCQEARQMVARGDLGEIISVRGSYSQDWLLYPSDYNWRVLESEGGRLRAIADIGTHWLDLMRSITGSEIEAVCADLKTVYPLRYRPAGEIQTFQSRNEVNYATNAKLTIEVTTEDIGSVMLRFAGGARGHLWVSQVAAGRKNCLQFEICGTQKAIAWDSEKPNELWIGRRDEANQILLRDPTLLSPEAQSLIAYPGGHNEGFPDTFKQCFKAFYDHIAAKESAPQKPVYPTFADGHREILLCEAILKSHLAQQWVSL